MQVVHGLWTTTKREGPGLFIWFEDEQLRNKHQLFEPISDFLPEDKGKPRGRTPGVPEPHPFALDSRSLFGSVRELLRPIFKREMPNGIMTSLDLMLPTMEEMPLPSPWLKKGSYGNRAISPGKRIFAEPWRVPGVHLSPNYALKWLVGLQPRRRKNQFGLVFGESIRYWKDAANLVFYSLIHGTYEPYMQKVDHQIKAKWQLNTNILANQMENLLKRLPASCQHEWYADGTRRTRESIVADFFDTSIDFLVRNVAGGHVLESVARPRNSRKRKKQNPLDSLTLPFIKGLYSRQNSFSAARDVQAAFVAMVSNWLKHKPRSESRVWNTCFTVLPPEIGNARVEDLDPKLKVWRVAFSLRNSQDTSQHIWAQEIWENLVPIQASDGQTLSELFLKDLGRALQHWPALGKVLTEPYPCYLDLTTEECYVFLTEAALSLQSMDFGVEAPPWWKKDSKRLKTKINIDSSAFENKGMLGFDSMINFSWKATVGGHVLSEEAFQKLVKHNIALIPIDGEWVEVRREDLLNAVNFFKDLDTSGEMSLREAMHLGLKSDELKTALEEVAFDYDGTLAQLFDNKGEHLPEVTQPLTLRGKLRPYQLRGLSWLAFHDRLGFGACLADDMGLGKTIQLLSLLLHERENRTVEMHRSPTLLICPMSVVGNWFREASRFTPTLRVMIHHGSGRLSRHSFMRVFENYDLIITTYHLVNRDQDIFHDIQWHRVALDEAQNIKNPSAQQSLAIHRLDAQKRISLTGTPVENKLSELWSILEFLNPGYLSTLKNFQSRFAIPIERQQDKKKADLLRKLTQPFILRRLKTDQSIIQDLPEKIEMKVYCDLTEEQAAMYQAYVDRQLNEIENAQGIARNQLVLTTLMKLKQICNHPTHFLQDDSSLGQRSGKLMRLHEMLEEALSEGDSSLIFTQFTQMGQLLEKYLSKEFHQKVLFMHGGLSQPKRQELVDTFQNGKNQIFILTVKTGGTGLNLTAANHVFHFDRWWNPAVENQATDRAFRIGQKRAVQVHKMIAIGTLEDRIDMMIEKKKELAENIIGTDEGWLSQLSTDALKDILTLSLNEG